MPTQTLAPDSTLAADSNLSGNHLTVDDDPDSPGGDWRIATSDNANSVAHHGFPTPTGNPIGTQTFKVYARLTVNGTACTYNIYVLENGTRLNGGAAVGTGSLTSTTGQLVSAQWSASLLGTSDGSLAECEFEVVKSGGAPGARTTGEVDAVEWDVAYSVAGIVGDSISIQDTATGGILYVGVSDESLSITDTATASVISGGLWKNLLLLGVG